MNQKSTNPIARQSKEWIKESMFLLMRTEAYDKITISEITDSANLHRRTFYRNFKSKDDVISYYFDTLCEEYIESLKSEEILSLPNITRVFFTFWHNHIEFLHLLEKNNLLYFLLEKLNEYLPHIYDLVKGKSEDYSDKEELRYALSYSVGGYWNTLNLWLKEGAQKTADELASIFENAMRINLDYLAIKN